MATGSSEVASPNTRLDEKDLAELHRVLYPARNKCNSFGLQIGLGFDEIENIESNKTDSGDRLLAILSVRLNKDKPLTWNEIYSALRSKPVDKRRLAEEIRQNFFEREYETKNVKKRVPKTQKGGDHRASVSKERESSEYDGIETVRYIIMKHVQEVESEGEALSRKELLSKKGKRKGGKPAHDKEKQVHDKERVNKFMKDESHSEPEEVREMSKQRKKATHDQEESVSDHNHHSDSEVCRKRVKKRSRKREVNIESESEASSDEEETQRSSLEDDTSHKESAKRKPVTKHTEMKIKVQKEHREDRKDKKDAKSRYSDETKKLSRSKKVETESDKESSSASSSDEEEIEVTKHIDNSKHTETKSADRTKDTTHFESEEKGKTSGKKRVSLKPQSTTAVSPCSELYKDKRRKKAIKVGKSVDSSKETYHKTSSKLPRNQREDQEERIEVVSGKKGKVEQDLPSSEMAETDSGDEESDESSEDENESEQKSSNEEEETENDDSSSVEGREEKGSEKSRKSKHKASTSTTTTEMRKTKSQDDDENSKQKKSSKALSKDDSHGDKEGSDPGGSRDQEDQPKKRNRRRHKENSKSPIVRGGSSSQEERKLGSRGRKRNKRGGEHNKKSNRKKRERNVKDGASGTDDSSPECDMVNQSEVEKKELVSVFECFYGQLCCVEFNPKEIAAQLQKKGLISIPVMKELIVSPESQQAKIITLIDALYEMIKSHPEHLFSCIEVMFKNDALQEAGRELLTEAGKQKPSCE